jgi:arabinogalactan oligomer/maltooligosaccharide transport system substrate-binding protein
MRRSIPFAVAAGLTLALAACSGSSEPADTGSAAPTTDGGAGAGGSLTIWVDETRMSAVQAAADAFQADTGATVELVQKNFEDIQADFTSQVPTGQGPDITIGAHDWLGALISNGVVSPIELGDKAADFQDVAVAAFSQDGQVYGVPYAIENIALIRNTDLAPTAPATWDEAVAAGQAAGTEFPILLQVGDTGDPYTMYPLQNSFGAPVFVQNDDGSYTSELGMGGDEGRNFAKWLQAQGQAGILDTAVTYDIAVQAFADGKSPFIIGGPWMLGSFEGLNLSIDPIPSAGGQTAAPFVGVPGFFVSAKSQNTILATNFLLNYVATDDVALAMYEAGDRPPALKSAAETASSDPITAGFLEVGKSGAPMPSIPEMASVWTFWGVTEAQIISGAADPVTAWDKMISDIQGAIGA